MKEIEKIIAEYQAVDWSREKAALGTVVKVEGSAYRRIGARMFVKDNGMWVGGISGGCLEGDALRHAQKAILRNKSSIVVYDTTEDDPHQIGVGLGCNGRIEVLFTPVDGKNADNQIEFLRTITDKRETSVLLQILSTTAVNSDLPGRFFTKSDLKKLAEISDIPTAIFREKINYAYRRRKSKVFDVKNEKGEAFEILVELIRPKIKLICIGDNYDVNAMSETAEVLGWELVVAGKMRKLGKVIHRKAKRVFALEQIDAIAIDDFSAVVLMSHDYKTDLDALKKLLKKDVPYLGLLGPKKRMQKMQEELDAQGFNVDLSEKSNIFGPVGLDIGAESPEEISLSIAAEIVAAFRKREGGFLRRREGSIHERI